MDEDLCKDFIQTLLDVEIDHIEYLNKQQEIDLSYDARGIRLDVYVKDSDRVFDLEMQASPETNLLKRARYYQSLLDLDCMERSNSNEWEQYEALKESYIVFICKKDPFKAGLPCYTIEQTCKENPTITEKINDKTHKVFYNASKWKDAENPNVRAVLKYIATSKTESDLTDRIDCAVERAKKNQSWRKKFMTLKEYTYRQYKDEMDGWRNLVAEKDEQLSYKDEQLRKNAQQLSYKDEQLSYKDEQLSYKDEQLRNNVQQLKDNAQQLSYKDEQLQKYEAYFKEHGITLK